MTNEEIKSECESHYKSIELSQERLKELREICRHEETFVGNYSWRVGSIMQGTICSFCGKLIKYNLEE